MVLVKLVVENLKVVVLPTVFIVLVALNILIGIWITVNILKEENIFWNWVKNLDLFKKRICSLFKLLLLNIYFCFIL